MKVHQKLIVVALSALLAVASHAAPISGFGAPVSDGALTGGTVVDFDSTTSGTYALLTYGDLKITANGPMHVGPDFNGLYNTTGGKSLFDPYSDNGGFTAWRFDFASGTNAFGFNWGAADAIWTLRAYDSSSVLLDSLALTATGPSNAGHYFGLAAAGISYATLTTGGGGDWVFIDRFTYNARDTGVPDSGATLAMLGLAFVSLACFRIRKAA